MELFELTATEIARAVNTSEISASSVAESFVKRASHVNANIQALVSFDSAYISSQAAELDQSRKGGRLTGVPIGIKDVFNTEFYPTQKGSPAWASYRAGNDARCVSYLRQEGGIIFAKTDTAELAVHADGKALNPYSVKHVTGSSSGGSAAAVATAMVPVALGTQTGGSTIRPASWCGVYAMKPSFGLIPRTGVLKTTDTLDTIGYFARSVSDLELLLETLRIRGDNFPIQEAGLKRFREPQNRNLRIAFCRSHLWDKTEDYVKRAMEGFSKDLGTIKGIEIVETTLPASTRNFQDLHRRIYHPSLAYYLKTELRKSPDQISETLKSIFEDAKDLPPEDYAVAMREQAELAGEIERFFSENEFDLIISNSSNGSAPVAEPDRHNDLNQLWTMSWLPVSNVPQFSSPEGLPFGFHVVGPKFSDYKMLSFLERLRLEEIIPSKSRLVSA